VARSDLIVDLVRAGVFGNADAVRATAEKVAAEERAKRHSGVAARIDRALNTAPAPRSGSSTRQNIRVKDGSGGIQRQDPNRPLQSLYLNSIVEAACEELIEEQRRSDVLRASGLEPRHRLLLSGPPGNGKTSLAEALAFELALPLFTVRYDAVITSYLGETAQRLRRLFDYVRTEPCVLFFDEFDAIGKERGDLHETGEIKRVVTTLLLQLDDLPAYNVLVGATNHPELLDRATWRRFQLRLTIDRPDTPEMERYFAYRLSDLGGKVGFTAKRLRSEVDPRSFSEAERFFEDIQRRIVLDQGRRDLCTVIRNRVKVWKAHSAMRMGDHSDDGSSATTTS